MKGTTLASKTHWCTASWPFGSHNIFYDVTASTLVLLLFYSSLTVRLHWREIKWEQTTTLWAILNWHLYLTYILRPTKFQPFGLIKFDCPVAWMAEHWQWPISLLLLKKPAGKAPTNQQSYPTNSGPYKSANVGQSDKSSSQSSCRTNTQQKEFLVQHYL